MTNKEIQLKLKNVFIEKYGTPMPMLIGRRFSIPHQKINEILTELNIEFENEYYIRYR